MLNIKNLIKKCDFSLNTKHKQKLLEQLLVIIDLRNSVCCNEKIIKFPKERIIIKKSKNSKQ